MCRRHDEETVRQLAELWGDDQSYGVAVRERSEDVARVLQSDYADFAVNDAEAGWDTASLAEEVRESTREEEGK